MYKMNALHLHHQKRTNYQYSYTAASDGNKAYNQCIYIYIYIFIYIYIISE